MNKPQVFTQTITLEDGREIVLETGKMARQAGGAVVLKMGNTMLLATAVASKEAKPVDFLPLSVDYQEKYSATGRFPGGFLKRESRLSDYEVLVSRLVDRAIRPLFPDDFHHDVQIMISLISADPDIAPDAMAGLAASAALTISDIPFDGPIAEVRVAKIDGKFIVNPLMSEYEDATLDIIVSGSIHDINMVEGEMKEITEAEMLEAIKVAHDAIKKQCQAQLDLREKCGKAKFEFIPTEVDEELKSKVKELFSQKIYEVAADSGAKQNRSDRFKSILTDYIAELPEDHEEDLDKLKTYYSKLKKDVIRNMVLDEGKRLDGRKTNEIRQIWAETDLLPSVHGSALFTRGETQALASITLGTKLDEQMIDAVLYQGYQKFILHYNFPGFSTGEVRPNRGPGRREVGHGNLALRALKPVLPTQDINPYTVRITSDILESNGSSSMATVCAGCLALLDAGVKITKPVSGIAMGLISRKDGKYAILSDILGDEDHLGDMDFKVTGTRDGITACQMDLKVEGLSYQVLEQALEQAKQGRLHILDVMNEVLSEPREDFKDFVPRIVRFSIDKEFIGAVIGTGGKVIQGIQKETGATISIDEIDGRGVVEVSSPNKESLDRAVKWIQGIVEEPEVGKTYTGTVKTIQPFGAFVEFMPGKEGLLHISEISYQRLADMEGIYNVGDTVDVKLLDVEKNGKFRLSHKALLPKPEGYVEPPKRDGGDRDRRDDRGGRGGDRGGRGGNDRGGRDGGRGGYGGGGNRNEGNRDRGNYGGEDRNNENRGQREGAENSEKTFNQGGENSERSTFENRREENENRPQPIWEPRPKEGNPTENQNNKSQNADNKNEGEAGEGDVGFRKYFDEDGNRSFEE